MPTIATTAKLPGTGLTHLRDDARHLPGSLLDELTDAYREASTRSSPLHRRGAACERRETRIANYSQWKGGEDFLRRC